MRKNKNWILIGLTGVLILFALGTSGYGKSLYTQHSNILQNVGMLSFSSNVTTDQNATEEERTHSASSGQKVLVTRVIDGDTIEIEGGERVRYVGIDTPETVDPRKSVQCFGREASAKNKELVEGKYVRLEKDITDADKYDRLLRYVYVDEKLVNLELVREGFAVILTLPPDVKYVDQFLAAQQEAREAKRGLWGKCLVFGAEETTCSIKGNISFTSGEKIYHLPSCEYYNQTIINESKGERWFCDESEALAAGWRKAQNCP